MQDVTQLLFLLTFKIILLSCVTACISIWYKNVFHHNIHNVRYRLYIRQTHPFQVPKDKNKINSSRYSKINILQYRYTTNEQTKLCVCCYNICNPFRKSKR